MNVRPSEMSVDSDRSGRALGSRRRTIFCRCRKLNWIWVLGLSAVLAAEGQAVAQQPMVPPGAPIAYPIPFRPRHLWDFFLPNDGIPRTYSYYYSPWLNQPHHFPVTGPDGRKYWRSTVRGVPMGQQWAAP
ncbi:MAG: hypothetical protein ACLQIB_19100 [Isosphaeraceae bacterium]